MYSTVNICSHPHLCHRISLFKKSLIQMDISGLTHQKMFDFSTALLLGTESLYLFSSFFIATNAYGGFVAVFTGLVAIAFTVLSWYGIRRKINRTIYGAVLGVAAIFVVIYLETAIFWGQYSGCESDPGSRRLTGVECSGTSAMKAVCAFSVFLFIFQLIYVGILLKYKNEILGTTAYDEGLGAPSNSQYPNSYPNNNAEYKRFG